MRQKYGYDDWDQDDGLAHIIDSDEGDHQEDKQVLVPLYKQGEPKTAIDALNQLDEQYRVMQPFRDFMRA
jgi:hypothetical protein